MGISDKDPALRAIHVSIQFDQRLWHEDIAGSRAHVAMLGKCGILSAEEVAQIEQGLDQVESELTAGTFEFRADDEDIHLNIERRLTEIIGPIGGKLHTGRSRNDQVATDLRLWCRAQLSTIDRAIEDLAAVLLDRAEEQLSAGTVLPFYTHLQRAQPVLLAHHLMAHLEAIERDRGRLVDAVRRLNESPLGAGAGAGSGYPIDPEHTAMSLGFARPMRNSLDAVAARDFALEVLAGLALLMTHLSRIGEEYILWSSAEFRFVTLGDDVTTGSSIMPQKRNPDGAELVRGKTGRVIGDFVALITALKAMPLAYNKDLQEDKEALFDAVDTSLLALNVTTAMIRSVTFHGEAMQAALETVDGYANATELADYLSAKGMPFRAAHGLVAELVGEARQAGVRLEDLGLERLKTASDLIDDDVIGALSTQAAVNKRSALMGTGPDRVASALADARRRWTS